MQQDTKDEDFQEGSGTEQGKAVLLRIKENQDLLENNKEPNFFIEYFKTYKSQNTEILNMAELNQSPYLRLKKYQQCLYYGDFQNSQRCGFGVMIYNDGRLFQGEWQNDYKFGRGYEIYPNGNRYDGFFVNGKAQGKGIYYWYNGETYDGQWLGGMKHGNGTWRGIKGDSYMGQWKFGQPDGYGVHTWINGDRYEGKFKSCLKHGEGTERFANGDLYVGEYVNGRPQGQGQYQWANGAVYRGEFKNGLRHGKGVWQRHDNSESDRFEGQYQNDQKCGQGVFKWASGNQYRGQYFDDMRQGYGEMFWTDQSYYQGQWDKGIQCGYGQLFLPEEGLRKGYFYDNIYQGEKPQNSMHNNSALNSELGKTKDGFGGAGGSDEQMRESQGNISAVSRTTSAFKNDAGQAGPGGRMRQPSINRSENQSFLQQTQNGSTTNPNNNSFLNNNSNYPNTNENSPNNKSFHIPKNQYYYDYNGKGPNSTHNILPDIRKNRSFDNQLYATSQSGLHQGSSETVYQPDNVVGESVPARHDVGINVSEQRQTGTQTQTPFQQLRRSMNSFGSSRGKSSQMRMPKEEQNLVLPPLNRDHSSVDARGEMGLGTKKKKRRDMGEILLKKHELILWRSYKEQNIVPKGVYQDLTDPVVCRQIRELIHPPIWKPTGIARSPTSRDATPIKIGGNHFNAERTRIQSYY